MNYADENYYINEYLQGKTAVITTAYNYYFSVATAKIKQYTSNNINSNNVPVCVKNCCCNVAEIIVSYTNNAPNVSSENVGDISITYESAESQGQVMSSKIKSAIYMWLSGTGLLYRGVNNDN